MTKFLTYIFIFFFTFISSVNAGYFVKSESGLGVFGHEIGHSMYGDDEATAGYLGSRFADAYTDGLWINGEDYSLGNWNIADGNSLYVGQNGSDFANVKNRDDCGPLCLTVFGIGAIISGIGAYKGGEAKAIVDYGYLGNNEYMRPDGTRILGEDLKTNLKIYGTMDISGSLLMAAAPLMKNGLLTSQHLIAGKISGYTEHGLMQVIGRDGGKGVSLEVILDSVKNPKSVIYQPSGAIKYVGKKGSVVLNKLGKIITAFGKARNK